MPPKHRRPSGSHTELMGALERTDVPASPMLRSAFDITDRDHGLSRHHVVVVGGGFAGVHCVRGLSRAAVEVTLIDRRNFHLFQPLTYQVATGALAPSEIAFPLRALFHDAPNVKVRLGEVSGFDLGLRRVLLQPPDGEQLVPEFIPYDTLVVSAGSNYSYFGHDEFAAHALEVKTLESAIAVRSKLLGAFERAENTPVGQSVQADLAFVIVGAGPTGVEMAGQIAELARGTLQRDYRRIDPRQAQVVLVDAGPRVLAGFPPSLSYRARRSLERLGITVMLREEVVDVDAEGVVLCREAGQYRRVAARTVIWAAGVTASRLAGDLAAGAGAELDRTGQVIVEPDLTLPDHPEVLVIGDMVRVRGGDGQIQALPGVAPVAIQQGRYAARLVAARLQGATVSRFRYRDKGNVATIGRASAVVDLRLVRLSGPAAWIVWLVVHLWYLVGVRNRLLVILQWSVSFVTGGRGARIIEDRRAIDPSPTGAATGSRHAGSEAHTAALAGARPDS